MLYKVVITFVSLDETLVYETVFNIISLPIMSDQPAKSQPGYNNQKSRNFPTKEKKFKKTVYNFTTICNKLVYIFYIIPKLCKDFSFVKEQCHTITTSVTSEIFNLKNIL